MTSDLHLLYFSGRYARSVYFGQPFAFVRYPPGIAKVRRRSLGTPLRHSALAMLRRSLSRYQAVAPAAAARLSTAVRAAAAGGQAAADALNAPLSVTDPELFDIIEHEKLRQARP